MCEKVACLLQLKSASGIGVRQLVDERRRYFAEVAACFVWVQVTISACVRIEGPRA